MANVSREQKEITKQRILKASADLFTKQGYATTTVRQIAEEANVSESSIFTYFNSKDHLLVALVIPDAPPLDHLVPISTPGETVVALMSHHFAEVFPLGKALLREFIAVLQRSPNDAQSTLINITHDFDSRLLKAIAQLVDYFGFTEPQLAMQLIIGIITANFQQFTLADEMTSRQCLAQIGAQINYALSGRYQVHTDRKNDQHRKSMLAV